MSGALVEITPVQPLTALQQAAFICVKERKLDGLAMSLNALCSEAVYVTVNFNFLNQTDASGRTMLHTAVKHHNLDAIKLLLAFKFNLSTAAGQIVTVGTYIDSPNSKAETPLVYAMRKGAKASFNYLRDQGANIGPALAYLAKREMNSWVRSNSRLSEESIAGSLRGSMASLHELDQSTLSLRESLLLPPRKRASTAGTADSLSSSLALSPVEGSELAVSIPSGRQSAFRSISRRSLSVTFHLDTKPGDDSSVAGPLPPPPLRAHTATVFADEVHTPSPKHASLKCSVVGGITVYEGSAGSFEEMTEEQIERALGSCAV